jgi:hypothetical protein
MGIKRFVVSLAVTVAVLLIAKSAFAEVAVPVEQILQELDAKVRMPIMLPDRLPRIDQVYPAVGLGVSGRSRDAMYYDNDYSIDFNRSPNCAGFPDCRFASFSASMGADFFYATDRTTPNTTVQRGDRQIQILEVRRIELTDRNGDRIDDVRFTRQCGFPVAPCGSDELATLEWRYDCVLYSATVVNGSLEDVVQIANSALQGGVRNRVKAP